MSRSVFTIISDEFIFSLYIHYTMKKRQDLVKSFYTNSDRYLVDLSPKITPFSINQASLKVIRDIEKFRIFTMRTSMK